MLIHVWEDGPVFQIQTAHTTYLMGVILGRYLGNLYYGKRMEDHNVLYLSRVNAEADAAFFRDKAPILDRLYFEYPVSGGGDFRDTCLQVRDSQGRRRVELRYAGYRIFTGKPALEGMPAAFAGESDSETLEITLRDEPLGLKILLRYSVFSDSDAIVRSVVAVNEGMEPLYLEKILSACIDMDDESFCLITLQGGSCRERHIQCEKLTRGKHAVASLRGETSHQAQAFLALTTCETSQLHGDVYAMHLIYSGNFLAEAERDYQDGVRMTLGIHPDNFEWVLEPGAKFETPEAVLVYSDHGIGSMTRTFHDLYRNHLIRSPWLHRPRPILINNWEATYFNFDDEKLLAIAREAKRCGIEMLVMDDGWFGRRNGDTCSLGDWTVNPEKIRCGMKMLSERIHAEGLKFGVWFEPEMVSPDSDLYRAHPDWAIQVPNRENSQSRNQFVLDLTRQEIADHVYESVASILREAEIDYVKWDMNRCLTDLGSFALDASHMGELSHRYMLAVYRLQERLLQEFPDLLLENCSGGGGRFDPGMLYYSPQIWTSDNMDPVERLLIQEGTALLYPLSTMGAHVGACPNHSVGRVTPLETRANVAMAGTFGYELDITKLPEKEKKQIAVLNETYHKYETLIREGDYFRIASYRENGRYDCWQVVDREKNECLVTYVQVRCETVRKSTPLRLRGLNPGKQYRLEETGELYSGELLMRAGFLQNQLFGDYQSCLIHLTAVK